ncbi:hypothetical protein [Mycolicibacterium mageritense]|uniref:hypothetical protein n=1 Tax=Mycolicibacterium mageritense TaxID=53462 RepID=UPI001E3CAAE8|nr:hypothetical protein [Mycolicibacterium mageritense]
MNRTVGTRSAFFVDDAMNSMTRSMLGRVHTGAADTGEALATIDRVVDGDVDLWVFEWEATADRIAAIAIECLRGGHRISARNAFLRAATYYTPGRSGSRSSACVLHTAHHRTLP